MTAQYRRSLRCLLICLFTRDMRMDILTFTVGDLRTGLPLHRMALSASLPDSRPAVNDLGLGSMDTTIQVVDMRRKFGLPPPPGEHGTRLIMVEVASRLLGLIINMSSPVSIIRDAKVDASTRTDNPYVTGMIMDQDIPIFLFDWDALLASETVLDVNNLFEDPTQRHPSSPTSQFLEAVVRDFTQTEDMHATISDQQIRAYAETYGIPLSVANRLVTFYLPQAVNNA